MIVLGREIDRLARGVIFLGRSMGEKTLFGIGPKMGIERSHPLRRTDAHHRAPLALARAFEQPGKHILQGLALQMIEKRFGHRRKNRIRLRPGHS